MHLLTLMSAVLCLFAGPFSHRNSSAGSNGPLLQPGLCHVARALSMVKYAVQCGPTESHSQLIHAPQEAT